MHLAFEAQEEQSLAQRPGVSPHLIAANHLLEMSAHELQEAITAELNDNPALEFDEVATCPRCGAPLDGVICPICPRGSSFERHVRPSRDDEDRDAVAGVPDQQTLAERMLVDTCASLPAEDHTLAEYVIDSLDDNGYLRVSVDDIAAEVGVTADRVRSVIKVVQAQEPTGAGARNVREHLLQQLDALADAGVCQPYARELVASFLTELAERRFGRIAHELHITRAEVEDAWGFIVDNLKPRPAHGMTQLHATERQAYAPSVIPDVVVSKTSSGELDVHVVERERRPLRVNVMYGELLAASIAGQPPLTSDEASSVRSAVARARMFIRSVSQRHEVVAKVTRAVIDAQREFVEHGELHVKPLTRAEIAARIGVHESTVSRATAGKYVLLPDRRVVPYADFFTANLSTKCVLRQVIAAAPRPQSDTTLVKRLDERGVHIARRTVTKYRTQLGILPSSMRTAVRRPAEHPSTA